MLESETLDSDELAELALEPETEMLDELLDALDAELGLDWLRLRLDGDDSDERELTDERLLGELDDWLLD